MLHAACLCETTEGNNFAYKVLSTFFQDARQSILQYQVPNPN